jgi:hypothetical protein
MELSKLKYQGDFLAASEVIQKWIEAKPDNKELKAVYNYLTSSYFYVNNLEMSLEEAKIRINKLRDSRDDALQTAEDYKEFYKQIQEKQI